MASLVWMVRALFVQIGSFLTRKSLGTKSLEGNRRNLSDDNITKVIVVVGRDQTELDFLDRVAPYLYDTFKIRGLYALGRPEELDDSEYFVAFISAAEAGAWTLDAQIKRLSRKPEDGNPLSIKIFDSMSEALDDVNEEYDFPLTEQIQMFRERSEEVFEKYGYATANETADFMTLVALAQSNMLALTRGLLDGVQVPVLVLHAQGSDQSLVRPVAILMTSDILENLELPQREGEDE